MKNAIISIDKKCEFDKIRGDNMFELINYEEENFQTHENQDFVMSKKKNKKNNKKSFLSIILASGLIICIITFYGEYRASDAKFEATLGKMEEQFSKMEEQFDKMQIKLEETQVNLRQFKNDASNEITDVKKDVKDAINIPIYTASSNFTTKLYSTQTNFQTNFLGTPSWKNNEVIAKNANTGRKYKAKDLMNKKILIPYKDDGQDAYFFGQFNKKNHWDGDCLINIYKNRKLTMIMEGHYNDGQLLSYQQVSYYKNHAKRFVWNVSKRETKGNINTGETYTYYKNKNKKAAFTKKTVEASDIMSVADFKEWITGAMEGYYCGNTQNGAYNDNTGKAYLIKYDKGKKVRTLYCGKFKNGAFHDESGNAWYISYDAENSTYIYFKGKFVNNKPVETSTHKRENISLNEIHQIMKGKHFNESVDLHER